MLPQSPNSSFTLRWLLQAGLGVLLIALLAVHLLVNHWVAPQGLLNYADIVRYYGHPGIVWMEAIFLIVVTFHCLFGLHAILLDLNVSARFTLACTRVLIFIGATAIVYGLWLLATVHSLSAS